MYCATKQPVADRGVPPDEFLDELVEWGRSAPDEIFAPGPYFGVYASVVGVLGPWEGISYRRAAMLEVMRVLAGLESGWTWAEARDVTTRKAVTLDSIEAGAWQVSASSMNASLELKLLVRGRVGSLDCEAFQHAMKRDRRFAMDFIARLLRRTTLHSGPVRRHEIDDWLRRGSVREFQDLLRR